MWFVVEKVPCAFEKNVYSEIIGWNILHKRKNPIIKDICSKGCRLANYKADRKVKRQNSKLSTSRINS